MAFKTGPLESRMNLSGQTVLVTGAGGFIGSHLCRRLVEAGARVHAVSRRQHAPADSLLWRQGDVAEIETVRRLLREIRPAVIFHLASHVMGGPDLEYALPTFRDNLQTTVSLLTAAAEIGCRRLVLTGSLAETRIGDSVPFPSSPYAAAKSAGTAYARMFHALYGVPAVMLRVFMVYGPGQKDFSKLIPYVILSLLEGRPPKVTSGKRCIDWIYVDDVVDGFIAAAQMPGVEGEVLDIGSGGLVSIREIVETLTSLLGNRVLPSFGALPDRPLEPTRTADLAETQKKLGWAPRTPLREGLRRTVEWFQNLRGIERPHKDHAPEMPADQPFPGGQEENSPEPLAGEGSGVVYPENVSETACRLRSGGIEAKICRKS